MFSTYFQKIGRNYAEYKFTEKSNGDQNGAADML